MLQFNNIITFENGKFIPNLEVGVYSLQEDQNGAAFLQIEPDFQLINLVGNNLDIANLVIDHYRLTENNFGILLQGCSGQGKTQTIKYICKQLSLPVVIINQGFNGNFVKSALDKIGSDCVVVFDEFEKVYNKTEVSESLLGLFDGIDTANRILYIVSANERRNVSQYFFGRPGRFLFNFIYEHLQPEEGLKFIQSKVNIVNKDRLLTYLKHVNLLSYDICDKIVKLINIHGEEKFAANAKYFNIIPIEYEYEYEVYYMDKVVSFGRGPTPAYASAYVPKDEADREIEISFAYKQFIEKGKVDQMFVCEGDNLSENIEGAKIIIVKRPKLWHGPNTVAY